MGANGIFRHMDAGYDIAKKTAHDHGLDINARLKD
jgi:urocanate hydratase